jgi:hypothetical protein
MKFIKKLTAYQGQKYDDALLGFGIIRAKDYDKDKFGHLILWSMNIGKIKFINKFFIYF